MKSRQFPSFNDAIAYLESKGELRFHGRAGSYAEYCIYTLTIGIRVYELKIYMDGKVEVMGERYK